MLKNVIEAAVLLSAAGIAGQTIAATSEANFQAKIVITSTCNVSTTAPTDLDFGTVAAGAVNVDTNSVITVTCSKGTGYSIALTPSNGNNDGTGTMAAATAGNTDTVPYAMYQDAARTVRWGSEEGSQKSGIGKGLSDTSDTHTVYGRVPSTDVTSDTYADTVTVVLTY